MTFNSTKTSKPVLLSLLMGPTSLLVFGGVSVQDAGPPVDLVEEGGAEEAEVSERHAGLLRHPV